MTSSVDGKTIAIWGDAICSAMLGDRRELVELLRHDNEVTPDLKEFLAWLLDERKNGRPPLPAKFKLLSQMAREPALFDAVVEFELERACCCAVSFDGEFSNTTSIYTASGVIRKQW
jgi:hypothetical protein